MSQYPDCLVIGGGLIGMLTARELALSGVRVRLLERGETGRESSWAGGGILSPLYPWRYPDSVSALARASQTIYPSLFEDIEAETGLSVEHTQSGLLMPDCNEIEKAKAWAKRFSVNIEITEGNEVIDIAGEISRELSINQGVWLPEVGQVRNPRLVRALRASIEHIGVDVTTSCQVDKVDVSSGKVTGVTTADGSSIKAESVVVTSGAWSSGLMAPLGLEISVKPVLGQMLLYKTEPGTVKRIILNKDRYVIPRQDGRVLVGSTIENTGFDKRTTESARLELEAEARRLVPVLSRYQVEKHWCGLRPGTPDDVPYIGAFDDVDGLYINAGHYRNGVVLGAASARLLSQIILEQEPLLPGTAYSPRKLLQTA